MQKDLINLIMLVWMVGIVYLIYKMSLNLDYMTELVSAYLRMVLEHSRH